MYLIWNPLQAQVAEIGWTQFAEGYTHNAGGFSHHPAGLSNHSANITPNWEWDLAKDYMMRCSPYKQNINARLQELIQRTLEAEARASEILKKRMMDQIEAARQSYDRTLQSSTGSTRPDIESAHQKVVRAMDRLRRAPHATRIYCSR
jgi:hypothetical protein